MRLSSSDQGQSFGDRRPGSGNYARVEREQRWLVRAVPDDLTDMAEIVDRYLTGTTLRLRRMASDQGVVYKLGQKVRIRPDDPEVVMLTNVYLTDEEYGFLSRLPGNSIEKTRYRHDLGGRMIAVDRFGGRHAPLVLAEVELQVGEPLLPLPGFAMADVTHDHRYSGGALAAASDEDLARLIGETT
jgi:CYTH domain-containing protein